jgi:hypothetical protein
MKMKTKICSAILALAAAAALAGCASTTSRINANPQLFASIAPANQELIRKGQIALGFTPDMVLLALGKPDIVAQRTDANGTSEMWRYQSIDNKGSTVVYMGGGWGGWGGWGGPAFYPYSMRGWGWNAWNYPSWGWSTTLSDFLRVSFRNGRVVEINRLR